MSIAQTFTVTAAGGKYYIDGVQQATVMIGAGLTYKFDQSDSSNLNHPLRFSSDSGNSTPYSTGVTTSGIPGNSGAYTQIAVPAGAPSTLYYYCTNHANMGGEANTDGWGRSYWSQADWGDTNVVETGWGRRTWGYQSWGDTPIVELTGLSATTSVGTLTTEIKPGWGTLTWGQNGWGTIESAVEPLTGLSVSSALGDVTPADVVGLTGLSATASVNAFASVSTNATITLPGLGLVSSEGLLTEDEHSVGLSGLSATSAVGALVPASAIGISGLSASTVVGSVAITSDPTHLLTGLSATSGLGSVEVLPVTLVDPSAVTATTSITSVSTTQLSNIFPTGQSATATVNGEGLILRYYGKLDPKTSSGYTTKTAKTSASGYSIKTPKNTTGYTVKTP